MQKFSSAHNSFQPEPLRNPRGSWRLQACKKLHWACPCSLHGLGSVTFSLSPSWAHGSPSLPFLFPLLLPAELLLPLAAFPRTWWCLGICTDLVKFRDKKCKQLLFLPHLLFLHMHNHLPAKQRNKWIREWRFHFYRKQLQTLKELK